jgi:hypothetical protein
MIPALALLRRHWPLIGCMLLLLVATSHGAKLPKPGVPVQGKGDPVPALSQDTIPRETLVAMYRTELGKRFHDEDADKLYQAHELLEQYFVAPTVGQRKTLAKAIQDVGLDAGLVGRICRIRMHWPALEAGAYYVNERHGPFDVRYFLGLPKGYDRTKAWPLVIKLPAADPFLTQPPPDADQVVKIYNDWLADETTRHPDAIVLMPLLNLDELYGPSYAGMNGVMQPILHAAGRVNIDPARVYLIGHSMGGHATWNLGLHYTTYFTAIQPLAGGAGQDWQRLRLMNLRNVLPVVWHDADDKVIRPESSRAVVKVLRTLKVDVDYVETKNLGHAPPENIAEERYQKLRARVRDLYPAEVAIQSNRPDTLFNRNDWVQIWQESNPGDDRRLIFHRGTGRMTVHQNSAKIEAKHEGNSINLTIDNVESMRLYFNDDMIDFRKPLKISINKKQKFEGYVKPNFEEMLNDQLFLGRGWRCYTAVLDIDLSDPGATTRPATNPATKPATRKGTITVGPGAAD